MAVVLLAETYADQTETLIAELTQQIWALESDGESLKADARQVGLEEEGESQREPVGQTAWNPGE